MSDFKWPDLEFSGELRLLILPKDTNLQPVYWFICQVRLTFSFSGMETTDVVKS